MEFAGNANLHRPPWSNLGLFRLAGCGAALGVLALFRRPWLFGVVALAYGAVAVGVLPFAGAALFCVGAIGTGGFILGDSLRSTAWELPVCFCLGQGLLGIAASLLGWAHACYPLTMFALVAAPAVMRRGWLRSRAAALTLPAPSHGATLIAFAATLQFLLVLKPEVGTDSLAMHLALPAYAAIHHGFSFDVHEFLWAAMPQTADWCYAVAYSLGGEFAARLVNFANFAAILALLYGLARSYASSAAALAACALFASGPLVQVVTGSLFIDNVLAATAIASFAAFWSYWEKGNGRAFAAGCLLLALALATKAGAIAFLPGLLALAAAAAYRHRLPLGAALGIAAAALPIAIYWYAVAWMRTGNPLFPYANEIFHSPLLDTARVAAQFREPLSRRTPANITFHSGNYIEGTDGAAGFQYFLLLPPALLWLLWRRQRVVLWAAAIGTSAFALSFAQISYLRYVYPELALLTLPLALWAEQQGRAAYALMALAGFANLLYQPAAGWYHRDFVWSELWNRGARAQYLRDYAPARLIVDHLNRTAPGEAALFCEFDHIAGFAGPVFTTNWHTYLRHEGLPNVREAAEVLVWLERRCVRYVASPDPATLDTWPRVLPAFLADFAEPVFSPGGGWTLYRVRPELGRDPPPPEFGTWDDADIRVALKGSWYRDFTCPAAWRRTLTRSSQAGDELRFSFRGDKIAAVYARDPASGIAEILVDGERRVEVDQYTPAPEFGARCEIVGLGPGMHTLVLRVTGRRNPASSGIAVNLDACSL